MDWEEVGPYGNYLIWVRELRGKSWVVAVTPLPRPPETRTILAAPPDEMVLPEGFGSKTAAVEAAKRYINRGHDRRRNDSGRNPWRRGA